MRRLKKYRLLLLCLLAVALLLGPGAADTNAIPLQDLFDGGSLTVGDKLFDNWELLGFGLDTDTLPPPNLADIEVTPLTDQPLNPGIRFTMNGEMSVVDEEYITLDFGFTVATLDGSALIKDNSLELTGYTFGGDGGFIGIDEFVDDADGNPLVDKFVQADNLYDYFQLVDSAEFPAQASIFVNDFIEIFGDGTGDAVSLDVFEQRFSQIPEPATLILLGSGLAGFAAFRKKLRKQSNS